MEKQINYKGKNYTIEIKWSGSTYCVRCINPCTSFVIIPNNLLGDIEKIKPFIIQAIEDHHELKFIEVWDGKL